MIFPLPLPLTSLLSRSTQIGLVGEEETDKQIVANDQSGRLFELPEEVFLLSVAVKSVLQGHCSLLANPSLVVVTTSANLQIRGQSELEAVCASQEERGQLQN